MIFKDQSSILKFHYYLLNHIIGVYKTTEVNGIQRDGGDRWHQGIITDIQIDENGNQGRIEIHEILPNYKPLVRFEGDFRQSLHWSSYEN